MYTKHIFQAHPGPRCSAHGGPTQGPDGAPMEGPPRALGSAAGYGYGYGRTLRAQPGPLPSRPGRKYVAQGTLAATGYSASSTYNYMEH